MEEMEKSKPKAKPYPVRRVIGPLVLSLFAIAWYQFSKIYLTGADNIALNQANFLVYVPPDQLQGYLEATTWICYTVVYVGLIMFWVSLVKYVQSKEVGS
ncbi:MULTISPECIES: hypothetical protein [Metallosphaera]|uniref:Uncharacterized protein n=3 Tax=Metallosphaera TaxID=41980 RepID=A4YDP6_METS5|nr:MULTISPECIES: hypothetical protein [Metallosphaera]ABP94548.1 hypothetical protein Msed_0371 [Metallosphaera sedula DSM 5348]AIM26535.1 hypothetical protein HA72_0371 [Metallosphaera sedula]AKV73525.1 hypothetical protein MsedA_0384 [Metallosphaera sedula]AKV75767.1 hypothetical protein MsedB_0384 [Metallosphaera sedula]AKV78014.1 hypothetical protein MsedC_0383 [Metallosphaera sedula]